MNPAKIDHYTQAYPATGYLSKSCKIEKIQYYIRDQFYDTFFLELKSLIKRSCTEQMQYRCVFFDLQFFYRFVLRSNQNQSLIMNGNEPCVHECEQVRENSNRSGPPQLVEVRVGYERAVQAQLWIRILKVGIRVHFVKICIRQSETGSPKLILCRILSGYFIFTRS